MISFAKPENLNGEELIQELVDAGIAISTDYFGNYNAPLLDAENVLWIDIDPADETKAKSIVAAHNGTTIASEPTVADKLASVGLSLDDLKEALGL